MRRLSGGVVIKASDKGQCPRCHAEMNEGRYNHMKNVHGVLEHYRVENVVRNAMYDGPRDTPEEEILSAYVVINGALGMTPGKVAAQVFHGGWMLSQTGMYSQGWKEQGRRVVVRVAETAHVFARVIAECEGVLQVDEGLTEVEHGAETVFVSIPYARKNVPKILTHKRCQLYTTG